MSKYKSSNFAQINRDIFKSELSYRAKWLYIVLSELEHRFTGEKEDFFFRNQSELSNDSGMTPKSNIKFRRELEGAGWIETWKMHWKNKETGKKSEYHTIAFRILR